MATWQEANILEKPRKLEEKIEIKKVHTLAELYAKPAQKMQEGYGAGFDLKFEDLELENVRFIAPDRDSYGCQCATFMADIKDQEYDWSAEHPLWAVTPCDDNMMYDKVRVKGSVTGYWENYDSDAPDYTNDEIAKEILQDTYTIKEVYGGGWSHKPVSRIWTLGNKDNPEQIDVSKERNSAYITNATLILDDKLINEYINAAENGFETEEESLHRTNRIHESIKGGTNRFILNVKNLLDKYMETDEDWKNMEADILSLEKYKPSRNAAVREWVEGGSLAIYYDDVRDELNEIYENTPEEIAKWSKYPDDKCWERYLSIMAMYIPKAFKLRMGRELGKMNESLDEHDRIIEAQLRADFIKDMAEADMDTSDLQAAVEAYAMETGFDEDELLDDIHEMAAKLPKHESMNKQGKLKEGRSSLQIVFTNVPMGNIELGNYRGNGYQRYFTSEYKGPITWKVWNPRYQKELNSNTGTCKPVNGVVTIHGVWTRPWEDDWTDEKIIEDIAKTSGITLSATESETHKNPLVYDDPMYTGYWRFLDYEPEGANFKCNVSMQMDKPGYIDSCCLQYFSRNDHKSPADEINAARDASWYADATLRSLEILLDLLENGGMSHKHAAEFFQRSAEDMKEIQGMCNDDSLNDKVRAHAKDVLERYQHDFPEFA